MPVTIHAVYRNMATPVSLVSRIDDPLPIHMLDKVWPSSEIICFVMDAFANRWGRVHICKFVNLTVTQLVVVTTQFMSLQVAHHPHHRFPVMTIGHRPFPALKLVKGGMYGSLYRLPSTVVEEQFECTGAIPGDSLID